MPALMEVYQEQETRESINGLTLTDVTMQGAIEVLRSEGIPICFEQVPLVPERAARLADGSITYGRRHFDVAIPKGQVASALNALTRANPDYQWEQVGEGPTYTVYPLESVLEWHVPLHDLSVVAWIDGISRLGLSEHGISLFSRGLERQPRVRLDFVPSENVARRSLTAIVDYVKQGRYWTLAGFLGGRTLVIGQVAPKESRLFNRRGYLISPRWHKA